MANISDVCKFCYDFGVFPCDDTFPCCPFDERFDKVVREDDLILDNFQ